jgi:flagellar biosynthesis component FlhA
MYKNIKNLMQEYPHITRDLKTSEVKIKTIHKVIEKLLMSGLAMRKFKEIIELVIFHSEENFNLDLLAFAVRSELRNEVLINNIARDGKIDGILLNKQDEEEIPYYELNREFYLAMDDIRKNILVERIKEIEKVAEEFSAKPILVVNKVWTSILLRELFIQNDIDIVVLTNHELYERDHQYSGTHILGELNTRDIAKNKEPQGNAEVEKLRRELIEKALKEKDRDLFEKMTSSNWEDYL